MLVLPPSGNKMEAVTASFECLAKEVQEMTDETSANCLTRAAALINLANQDYVAELTDLGIRANLGFIFTATTNPGTFKPSFHVLNYLVGRCIETPEETIALEADAYFGESRPIINKDIRSLLIDAENPSFSIVYSQSDYASGVKVHAQTDTLRPAPFRLKRQANREVYLGEEVGFEALSELADNSDIGKEVDKNKIPVLLLK